MEPIILLLGVISGLLTILISPLSSDKVYILAGSDISDCSIKCPDSGGVINLQRHCAGVEDGLARLFCDARFYIKREPRLHLDPENGCWKLTQAGKEDSCVYIALYSDDDDESRQLSSIDIRVVSPDLTLMVDTKNHLLICTVDRFYPPKLDITWSDFPRGDQIHENVTENEDGTFTKTSIVSITEDIQGHGLFCNITHSTLSKSLYLRVPVLSLIANSKNNLLICKAERFYPSELDIFWSDFPRGDQIHENLTENEDGTFIKTSIVSITEDIQGHGVFCNINHITLSKALYLHAPVLSLMVDTKNQLLICKAERFYPPELDISWSNFPRGEQIHDYFTENEDKTFTKTSIVSITEDLQGYGIFCHLNHSTINKTLYLNVTPLLSLMVDTRNHLLICKADGFYPSELDISWSNFLRGDQIHENLTENEDGTFTKTSIVSITEDIQGLGVSCTVHHSTLSKTLYLHDSGYFLYQQLFPARVLLLILLILSLVSFHVYRHLQEKCSGD